MSALSLEDIQNVRTRVVKAVSFRNAMIFPSFFYIMLLVGVPALFLVYLSVTKDFFSIIEPTKFVGLDIILQVLQSSQFWEYLINTLIYAGAITVIGIPLQLGIALTLNVDFPFSRVWDTLLLLPWAIPFVLSAVIWVSMFNPNFGVINYVLLQLGLISTKINWFGGKWIAFSTIIIVTIWINTPIAVIVFRAGLQSIPDELYEAGRIDGAGVWNRFRHVTLPLLRPSIRTVLLLESLLALRGFEIVFAMTQGGPGDSTTVIAIDMFRNLIRFGNVAVAAAESILLITLMVIVLIIIDRVVSTEVEVQ